MQNSNYKRVIKNFKSIDFPIKLFHTKEAKVGLYLLLCSVDDEAIKASVILFFNSDFISESAYKWDNDSLFSPIELFFTDKLGSQFGSDEIKEQTKSLARLLGGESIGREGLIRCEEGGSRMGVIEWRLEDYHTDKTKSA